MLENTWMKSRVVPPHLDVVFLEQAARCSGLMQSLEDRLLGMELQDAARTIGDEVRHMNLLRDHGTKAQSTLRHIEMGMLPSGRAGTR